MAKSITTKYGTKIDVTGLNAKQIEKVRAMSEDKGAYGSKGAALAKTLQKQSAKKKPEANKVKGNKPAAKNLGINKNTGAIDPNIAVPEIRDQIEDDVNKTFNLQNPGSQTDAYGNKRNITKDPETGEVIIEDAFGDVGGKAKDSFMGALGGFKPFDLTGAPKILQTGDVRDEATKAADANYAYMTKNYAKAKTDEMEAKKQELAERGIPLDADPNSLYGKTMKAIDDKYRDMDDQAKNMAISKANETLQAQMSGQSMAYDSFLKGAGMQHQSGIQDITTFGGLMGQFAPNFTPYQGGVSQQTPSLLNLIDTISDADLAKFGMDQDMKIKLKTLAAQQAKAGGSGGGSPNAQVMGRPAPGF